MTWAGALMQPKKIQTPSPGTCATRTLSEGAWQSVRFFRTLRVPVPYVEGLWRLPSSSGDTLAWPGQRPAGPLRRAPDCASFLGARDTVVEARPAFLRIRLPAPGAGRCT